MKIRGDSDERNHMNQKGLSQAFIIILVALLTAAFAGGGVWYWQQQELEKANKKNLEKMSESNKSASTKEAKEKEEVPADFTSVELNDATIYYPEDWGKVAKEESKEDLNSEENPYPSFAGEVGKLDQSWPFYVIDMESYEKSAGIKDEVTRLKKVYDDQKIDASGFTSKNSGFLPVINAAVLPYGAKYVENNDASWRGYWYLANIGQAVTAEVSFVAVMYNKKTDKVFTISRVLESDKSDDLKEKIVFANDPNTLVDDIKTYMETVYKDDKEIKDAVDNEMLKICNFVK